MVFGRCALLGLGHLGRNPDARWRTSPASVKKAAKKQLALLEHTAPSVKPGGLLVYAVCTLTLPETHEVIAQFLSRHPEFKPVRFPPYER